MNILGYLEFALQILNLDIDAIRIVLKNIPEVESARVFGNKEPTLIDPIERVGIEIYKR